MKALTGLVVLLSWCICFVAFIRYWDSMSIVQGGIALFGLLVLFGVVRAIADSGKRRR